MSIIAVAVAVLALGWFLGHAKQQGGLAERAADKLKFVFFGLFLLGVVISVAEVLLGIPAFSTSLDSL